MKKLIAALTALALVFAMCGCAFEGEAQTEEVSETPTESEISEPKATEEAEISETTENELWTMPSPTPYPEGVYGYNAGWIEDISEYYYEVTDGDGFEYYYDTTIPGEFSYIVDTSDFSKYATFTYLAENSADYVCYISLTISVDNGSCSYVGLTYDLSYREEGVRLYTYETVAFGDVADFVSSATENFVADGSFCVGDINSVPAQDDLNITYSRFVNLCERVFSDANVGVAESGVNFGEWYKDINPTTPLSFENRYEFEDHVFEDGVCTDCGITWDQYLLEGLEVRAGSSDYLYYTGTNNEHLMNDYDYTCFQYYMGVPLLIYSSTSVDEIDLDIEVAFEDNNIVTVIYSYGYGFVSTDEVGIVGNLFEYRITFSCDRSDLDSYLSSPNMILENAQIVFCFNGEDSVVVFDYSDKDTYSYFEDYPEYESLSQEDLCSLFLSQAPAVFTCFDDCLGDINTSFADGDIELSFLEK